MDPRMDTGCEFVGQVEEERFRVTRRIAYRNSFLPVVSGKVDATPTGAHVRVSMKPHSFMVLFAAVWVAALTPVTVAILAHVVSHGFSPVVLVLIAFLAASYALVVGGFTLEARRTRRRLIEVLQAVEMPAGPARHWPEGGLEIRWADVRGAGRLGLLWIGCYAVAAALGLYDWVFEQAGCTNPQAHNPAYTCPTGAHTASGWTLLATAIASAFVGLWAVRRRQPHLLIPVILVQVALIGCLAWVARDPAFHVHLR